MSDDEEDSRAAHPGDHSRAHTREGADQTDIMEAAQLLIGMNGERPQSRPRRRFIQEVMEAGAWVRGKTGRALAVVWRLHPDTVKRDAKEVWSFLCSPEDAENAKRRMARVTWDRSEAIWDRAQLAGDREAAPLYAASNTSAELYGKVTGAIGNAAQVVVDARRMDSAGWDAHREMTSLALARLGVSQAAFDEAFDVVAGVVVDVKQLGGRT